MKNDGDNKVTSINVRAKTKKRFRKLKNHPRETDDEHLNYMCSKLEVKK